jgi:hypothetical protein
MKPTFDAVKRSEYEISMNWPQNTNDQRELSVSGNSH